MPKAIAKMYLDPRDVGLPEGGAGVKKGATFDADERTLNRLIGAGAAMRAPEPPAPAKRKPAADKDTEAA